MATPNDALPEPPVFFVHVMKTGGTTLFRHLRENYPLDELYPYSKLDIRYEGERLEPGRKSLGIEVVIQPREATLTEAEIDALAARIVAAVTKATGATLRT